MKVTIYTTSTCPFSQQEKAYLQGKNIAFEEKNLEVNRDFLNELLAVSNNFAGTPVTKIDKDDGQSVVLKGFTEEEFDNVLGPAVQVMQQPPAEPTSPPPPTPPPAPEPPTTDTPPPTPPVPEPEPPVEPPTPPPPTPEPEAPPSPVSEPPKQEQPQQAAAPDPLDAILKDLQSKVNETYSAQQNQPNPPAGGPPAPQPVDQPPKEEPEKPPPPPPPTPGPTTPLPTTPPTPSTTVIPDFPNN